MPCCLNESRLKWLVSFGRCDLKDFADRLLCGLFLAVCKSGYALKSEKTIVVFSGSEGECEDESVTTMEVLPSGTDGAGYGGGHPSPGLATYGPVNLEVQMSSGAATTTGLEIPEAAVPGGLRNKLADIDSALSS